MPDMTNNFNPDQKRGTPTNKGSWAANENGEPEGKLPPVPQPVALVRVTLEEWDQYDNAREIDDVEFDARPILDTLHLGELSDGEGETIDGRQMDVIFEKAVKAGLAEPHDGPFTVDLDDDSIGAYIDARRASGQLDPVATALPRRPIDDVDGELLDLEREEAALSLKRSNLAIEGVSSHVLALFPSAKEIQIESVWNKYDEHKFEVSSVRDDKEDIWVSGAGSAFEKKLSTYTNLLTHFDFDALHELSDSSHDSDWHGICL